MTGRRSSYGESYWAGYERGVQAGHAAGYAEGVTALEAAADALAGLRPSKTVEVAAARRRLAESPGTGVTPRELRVRAAQSWGPPVPADLADPPVPEPPVPEPPAPEPPAPEPVVAPPMPAAEVATVGAELADDDDWAWQV